MRRCFVATLMVLAGCSTAPPLHGVYKAGENAVIQGRVTGDQKLWGPDGMITRTASEAPGGNSFVGSAGPLWQTDHDIAAPLKAPPVPAVMVERAGWRIKEVLGTTSTGAIDPAKSGGVFTRSLVKVRRDKAPPVYVISATGDEVGAGRMGGPADVRSGENCKAAVGTMDDQGNRLLSGLMLEDATRMCAVPMLLPPVDFDGNGIPDILAYGQNGTKGFRTWLELEPDGTLVKKLSEAWDSIP